MTDIDGTPAPPTTTTELSQQGIDAMVDVMGTSGWVRSEEAARRLAAAYLDGAAAEAAADARSQAAA
jgi:hypothetical protein